MLARGRTPALPGLVVLFAVLTSLALPALAGAATFTVNTTADNPPNPGECGGVAGDCSLRQAIDLANGEPGPDTVVLPAGHYGLTIEPTSGTPDHSGDLNVLGELTIEGAGARKSVIDASAIEDRVLELQAGGILHLVDLGVTGGHTSGEGGGIYDAGGDLVLEGAAVSDNEVFGEGAGGGIAVENHSLTVLDSVISGNRDSGEGGGIKFFGSELKIENSTIADNEVNTALIPSKPAWGAYGGAIEGSGGRLAINGAIIAGNRIIDGNGGETGGGSAFWTGFAASEVANTIVADNTGVEVEHPGQCHLPLGSLGHNLESEEPAGEPRCFGAATDLIADPLLGALANNGGETDTMALGTGSPAIDAGDAALCLPTDQRGEPRPAGAGCDIGAYEAEPTPPAPPTPPPPPATPEPTPITPGPAQPNLTATTPGPAGGWFGIKAIERDLKKGTARLAVNFTGSGEVTVTGAGVSTATKMVSSGTSSLAVVPTGKLKAKLMRTGKVKVTVAVSFKTAGNVWAKTKVVSIRLGE